MSLDDELKALGCRVTYEHGGEWGLLVVRDAGNKVIGSCSARSYATEQAELAKCLERMTEATE